MLILMCERDYVNEGTSASFLPGSAEPRDPAWMLNRSKLTTPGPWFWREANSTLSRCPHLC